MSKHTPALVRIILALIAIVAVVSYVFFNSRVFIAGPKINVSSPQNGCSTDKNIVEIVGNTENTSAISINDRPILIDESGNFKESLLLVPGYNIIMIEAKDKFDRHISERLDLFYKANKPAVKIEATLEEI